VAAVPRTSPSVSDALRQSGTASRNAGSPTSLREDIAATAVVSAVRNPDQLRRSSGRRSGSGWSDHHQFVRKRADRQSPCGARYESRPNWCRRSSGGPPPPPQRLVGDLGDAAVDLAQAPQVARSALLSDQLPGEGRAMRINRSGGKLICTLFPRVQRHTLCSWALRRPRCRPQCGRLRWKRLRRQEHLQHGHREKCA